MAVPPPRGYRPARGIVFGCPPGGLYLELVLWVVDYLNDSLQAMTFIQNHDYFFAAVLFFFVGISTFLATDFSFLDVLGELRKSLRRGVPTAKWRLIFASEQRVEAPGTGLVAPYGQALLSGLTPLQAVSALYGLWASASAMAKGRLNLPNSDPQTLGLVRPWAARALHAFAQVGALAELATFALASAVLHPAVTCTGYLGAAALLGALDRAYGGGDGCEMAVTAVLVPSVSLFGGATAKIHPANGDVVPFPAWPEAVFILVRLTSWWALCLLELPQGLLPLGSLSRPMGWTVLRERFLSPAKELMEYGQGAAGAVPSLMHNRNGTLDQMAGWPEKQVGMTVGSATFNTAILAVSLIVLPMYLLTICALLVLSPEYRAGRSFDPEATQRCEELDKEIEAWAEAMEREAEEEEAQMRSLALLKVDPSGSEAGTLAPLQVEPLLQPTDHEGSRSAKNQENSAEAAP